MITFALCTYFCIFEKRLHFRSLFSIIYLNDFVDFGKLLLSPKNQLWEDNKKRLSLFNIIEIERTTKHLNNEMDESSKDFYKTKKKTMDYNYKSINIFL